VRAVPRLKMRVLPWHLPYNCGKSTEKPQSGCEKHLSQGMKTLVDYKIHTHVKKNLSHYKIHTHQHTQTNIHTHTHTNNKVGAFIGTYKDSEQKCTVKQ
jgi:hypothetical protein